MDSIPLPASIALAEQGPSAATITIEPCYPGYGTTLGNALRRVLLSSLPGSAITQVKIHGANHEFSAVPNVQEDVVDLLLNLKQVRVKLHEGETATVVLNAKGEKDVTAGDLECPSNVEVGNPDQHIATLTDKSAELKLELTVTQGRGYVPVETQERQKEIGVIALDGIYTPVRNVNFTTQHVRVGQMTNYDKLVLTVVTDGTITPAEAFKQAASILLEQFTFLNGTEVAAAPKKKRTAKAKKDLAEDGEEAAAPAPEADTPAEE